MAKIKIFLSWSGEKSRLFAELMQDLINPCIPSGDIFLSSRDIEAGALWNDELRESLGNSGFGIICLTGDNKSAPWIMYEAGALSQMVGKLRVAPILIDLSPSSLSSPLSDFQATRVAKPDILKLVQEINKNSDEDFRIDEKNLNKIFEAMWSDFEIEYNKILKSDKGNTEISRNKTVTNSDLDKKIEKLFLEIQKIRAVKEENNHYDLQISQAVDEKIDMLERQLLIERRKNRDLLREYIDINSKDMNSSQYLRDTQNRIETSRRSDPLRRIRISENYPNSRDEDDDK